MSQPGWPLLAALVAACAVLGAGGPATRLADLGLAGRDAMGLARHGPRVIVGLSRLLQRRSHHQALVRAGQSVPAALALELRSGRGLAAALAAVAGEHGHLPEAASRLSAAAAAVDAGAVPALVLLRSGRTGQDWQRDGRAPPSHQSATGFLRGASDSAADSTTLTSALRPTAACLAVGHRAGLPLGDLLESAASAAGAAAEVTELARVELAGAQASAWLLAGLPGAGLVLGHLIGARPGRFLLATGAGRLCLVVALLLTAAGWVWTQALTHRQHGELLP